MNYKHNPNLTEYARTLRKNMTKEERHLWYDFLKNYPVRFLRQKVIDDYIVDFYCSKARLVIELDGSQHYKSEEIKHDAERTEFLENLGLKVIRFSNLDVTENFYEVCTVIDSETKKRIG